MKIDFVRRVGVGGLICCYMFILFLLFVFFLSFFCGNVALSFFFFQILVFCSKTVFNLSRKVLTATGKRVLDKGLRFAPAPIRINESVLKRDFNDFFLKMRCKWYFRNKPRENFSEEPAFNAKSNWNPPKGHPTLEIFLSNLQNEVFLFCLVLPAIIICRRKNG